MWFSIKVSFQIKVRHMSWKSNLLEIYFSPIYKRKMRYREIK